LGLEWAHPSQITGIRTRNRQNEEIRKKRGKQETKEKDHQKVGGKGGKRTIKQITLCTV
jgi:hypothetical protein